MTKYIDRKALLEKIKKSHCIGNGCNSYNGVRCRSCEINDAINDIEDAPEPSSKDRLRYALEVIRDECRSHNGRCRGCLLCEVKSVGIYCSISDTIDYPADWKPEKMIQEVKNDG